MKNENWRTLCIIAILFSLSMLMFEGASYVKSSPSFILLHSHHRSPTTAINEDTTSSRLHDNSESSNKNESQTLKEEPVSSLLSSAPSPFHQIAVPSIKNNHRPLPPYISSSSSHSHSPHPSTSSSSPPPPSLSLQALLPSRVKLMANTSNSHQCNTKYPPHTLRMLATTIKRHGVRKVAIAGLFKDCAHLLPTMDAVLQQVIFYLGARNVFISFFESRSSDNGLTAAMLQQMGKRLQELGVSNVVSYGETERLPMQRDWREHKKGNRIDYLSKLRNAALLPILEAYPTGYFDKVFFVNDVYLCGGDILRLLAHDADIACGLDFKNGRFYDSWVMEKFQYEQHHHDGENTKPWDLSLRTPAPPLPFKTDAEEASRRVLACWNGGVAFGTGPLYRGVRFRRGMPELAEGDCSQSECSLWSMDFHNLGYHRIIVDPSVQLAYDRTEYNKWFRQPRLITQRTVHQAMHAAHPSSSLLNADLTLFNENTTYRCCEIEGTSRQVDFRKCSRRKLRLSVYIPSNTRSAELISSSAARGSRSPKTNPTTNPTSPSLKDKCRRNAALCLKYTPARWVVHWEWRQWMLIGGSSGGSDSTQQPPDSTSSSVPYIPHNHPDDKPSLLTPLLLPPESLSTAVNANIRRNKKKPKLLVIERGVQ